MRAELSLITLQSQAAAGDGAASTDGPIGTTLHKLGLPDAYCLGPLGACEHPCKSVSCFPT